MVANGFYCFTSTYAGVKFYQFTFFCTRLSLKNEHDFVLYKEAVKLGGLKIRRRARWLTN
ncbi:hypothetical protein EEQ72_09460 [Escherichia coli]|nr:hypothetical protein [Escherichia coli]